jgi:hypothetical protein
MKRSLLATIPALLLASQANALVGIAVSGGLNSTSISAANQTLSTTDLPVGFYTGHPAGSLSLQRGKMSSLTQLGVKAWLELPVIPVEFELAENVGFGSYTSNVVFTDGTDSKVIPLDIKSPIPGLGSKSGSTPYFSSLTDLTLRYPVLEFPPLSPIKPLKIWVGAGGTYAIASHVVDKTDLKDVFSAPGSFDMNNPSTAADTYKSKLTTSTFGGHLAAGVQLKIPVLPIALFIDGKWYLHVGTSDAASKYPFAANAGLGFSI